MAGKRWKVVWARSGKWVSGHYKKSGAQSKVQPGQTIRPVRSRYKKKRSNRRKRWY